MVQPAGESDIEDAVQAAWDGFKVWSAMNGATRGRILRKAADIARGQTDALTSMETQDTGLPCNQISGGHLPPATDALEFFGSICTNMKGSYYSDFPRGEGPGDSSSAEKKRDGTYTFAYTRREPIGVCAGIGAWNYPFMIAAWKAAPCLAAGNSFIFKPSEMTPVSAGRLGEILIEAGVPAGVFNVVQVWLLYSDCFSSLNLYFYHNLPPRWPSLHCYFIFYISLFTLPMLCTRAKATWETCWPATSASRR